ncbi:MAG: TonB family protein [Emcibacteraceae bacterium]|nr:TonB family protein [Emcibacteraceae bacterium]
MLKNIIIISLLLITTAAADQAADKAEFKRLYAEFSELYANSEELDPIIEVAEQVYNLAQNIYGKSSQNTAVVLYNLASLYDEKGSNQLNDAEIKAVELYKVYFKILDKLKTPKDETYLDQYFSFVIAENNALGIKSKKLYANRAMKIAQEVNLPPLKLANIEHTIAIINVNKGSIKKAKTFFNQSKENYSKAEGVDHIGVGKNLFWLAKIDVGNDQDDDATEKFLKSIEIFDKNGFKGNDLALISHANLVQIYEKSGQSDKATKHCIAASVERPVDVNRYFIPLYRAQPKYPRGALNSSKEGYVVLEFIVDESGFTKDVKVIESSSKVFEKGSLAAARKYRYAPTVRDGKLIATTGVRVRVEYKVI